MALVHPVAVNRHIDKSIFRAYDIRGLVDEQLNADVLYTLGLAFAHQALTQKQTTVIVGYDARLSSPHLSQAFRQGLLHSGVNVIDIGAVSSPMLYFATHHLSSSSGVMITGSHNPNNYNGLKMIMAGENLSAEAIQELYRLTQQQPFVFSSNSGSYQAYDIYADYAQAIQQAIALHKPLKVVVDCGNSIMGRIAPEILRQLGCAVIELFCEIDGTFPNHHPDPSDPENLGDLVNTVLAKKADLGIAFDGDGDRLGVVSNHGKIIPADQILMLLSQALLQECPHSTIVYDVKCSMHLTEFVRAHSGKAIEWKTGHSLIKQKMLATNAALAGEMSGHIFFQHRWFGFDDGLYASCRLLEFLCQASHTLDELHQQLPQSIATHELKIPITEEEKFTLIQQLIDGNFFIDAQISTLDGLKAYYQQSWGLVRASNTSPNITARFEAQNQQALFEIQRLFSQALRRLKPDLIIPWADS